MRTPSPGFVPKAMTITRIAGLAAVLISGALVAPGRAGDGLLHHLCDCHGTCARLCCGVSTGPHYHYGHDIPRKSVFVVSALAVPTPVTLTEDDVAVIQTTEERVDFKSVDGSTTTTRTTTTQRRSNANRFGTVDRQCKRFVIAPVVNDQVRIDFPSAVAYDDGEFIFSGILVHDGGPFGALKGNWVTVSIRGLADQTNEGVPPSMPAPVVWETSERVWASKDTPIRLAIGVPDCKAAARHYNELTHIEVQLEYRIDR